MKNFWNLKLSDILGVLFFALSLSAAAQFSEPEIVLPNNEGYLFPLKPGNPASLAGTMGELRSTHFHTGLDIRTNSEIGWPVRAAKSGYIIRAGVSSSGFGNVVYVKHPDGNTTVYGHLDAFNDALDDYIRKERYRRKTSNIDLYFNKDQFPVNRGDTIAFAGNTGTSAGPHLHFDIRDKDNKALNPLNFNFSEVRDNASPIAQKIAFKTLDINSRVNDRFGRFEFYLQRSGNNYILTQPILAYGNIGIELQAYDLVDNNRAKCGVNHIEVYADSILIFKQSIEELNLTQARGIYTLMDFRRAMLDGNRFYKLYLEDGNKLKFYAGSPGNGRLKVKPEAESNIHIIMKDFHGNTSTVRFRIKQSDPIQEITTLESAKKEIDWSIEENTLMVTAQSCATENQTAQVYTNGLYRPLEPAYFNKFKTVYLVDLRTQFPDSIVVCDNSIVTNLKSLIPPGTEYKFFHDRVDIRFPKDALYDTLYFAANHQITTDTIEVYSLGPLTPFNRSISVSLKPVLTYSMPEKTAVYRVLGKSYSYEGGEWSNGRLTFSPRELGEFAILTDTVPPSITRIYVNNQAARFKIRDSLSGIAKYEATINGKWLLLNYDAKTNTIMTERLNKKDLLKGDLEVTITDNAGNQKIYSQKIQ